MALNSESVGKLTEVMADFEIKDLRVSVEGREILKGVSLAVNKGEVHAVMGPNGSGKSTLSHTLMGHPNYKVLGGQVLFKGKDILTLPTEQRAKLGMFLALQYPVVVPGITLYGPRDSEIHGGAVSFTLANIHPHDLATLVDREGIAVRAGHHCTQPLMDRLGVAATTRASFYIYNRADEVDQLVTGIQKAQKVFA